MHAPDRPRSLLTAPHSQPDPQTRWPSRLPWPVFQLAGLLVFALLASAGCARKDAGSSGDDSTSNKAASPIRMQEEAKAAEKVAQPVSALPSPDPSPEPEKPSIVPIPTPTPQTVARLDVELPSDGAPPAAPTAAPAAANNGPAGTDWADTGKAADHFRARGAVERARAQAETQKAQAEAAAARVARTKAVAGKAILRATGRVEDPVAGFEPLDREGLNGQLVTSKLHKLEEKTVTIALESDQKGSGDQSGDDFANLRVRDGKSVPKADKKKRRKMANKDANMEADNREAGKKERRWERTPEETELEDEEQSGERDGNGYGDEDPDEDEPTPELPRTCYVENTYLGGNAAHEEMLRRLDLALGTSGRPHRLAVPQSPAFDPPAKSGMAVTATLSKPWFDAPGRVYLQVGLRGSDRYGWRRPPLELVIVVDPAALLAGPDQALELLHAALDQLGPQDRLAVVVGSHRPVVMSPLQATRRLRTVLEPQLGTLIAQHPIGASALGAGMARAGELLAEASADRTTVPGTQIVLLLTAAGGAAPDALAQRVDTGRQWAHALATRGVVTSVLETPRPGSGQGHFWPIANAGHGNYHRVLPPGYGQDALQAVKVADALADELETLSKVVARLLRLNIRLMPHVKGVRVLGSRVLDAQTVAEVKARESATDQNLSRAMGIEADRGDDDDGIQTVIPYFYGGDSHVVVLELEVDEPGPVADITLRYKDLVNVDNAVARTSVTLRNLPRAPTGNQELLARTLEDFSLADRLARAARRANAGDLGGALSTLTRTAATSTSDRVMLDQFIQTLQNHPDPALVSTALRTASQRKVGGSRSTPH